MDSIEQALYAADAETSAIAAGRNPSERSHQANLSHSLREAIKLLAKERRKAQQELAAEREKVERLEAALRELASAPHAYIRSIAAAALNPDGESPGEDAEA